MSDRCPWATCLIFAANHRLWVLVRTASPRRFLLVPTIYVLSKNEKNIKKILKIFIFYNFKYLYILHGYVFVIITRKSRTISTRTDRCSARTLSCYMTTVVDTTGPRVPTRLLPSRCYKSVKMLCKRYSVPFSQILEYNLLCNTSPGDLT